LAHDTMSQDTDRFFANRRREFLFVAGVALVIIAAMRFRTDTLTYDHPQFLNPWDHHKYIWMTTNNPFDFHIAPFCWRVGTPALAAALPFDIERSFMILNYLALWMTGVAMFYLARRFGFSKTTAFTGMVAFFSIGWVVKANLYNIFKPDPLAFLFVTLTIYCIVDRRDVLYTVLLAVGVLFKESVIIVAPLYYTLRADRLLDFRLLLRAIILSLPAVAVFVAIRLLIPMKNEDFFYLSTLPEALQQVQLGRSTFDLGWLWREIGLERLKSLSPESLLHYTVGTFGAVAALMPLFAVKKNLRLLTRFLPYLILVYAQILFATNDTRLLAIGFPAVIIMALNGAEAIARHVHIGTMAIAGLFGVLICLLLVRTWMLFLPGIYEAVIFLTFLAFCFSRLEYKSTVS